MAAAAISGDTLGTGVEAADFALQLRKLFYQLSSEVSLGETSGGVERERIDLGDSLGKLERESADTL